MTVRALGTAALKGCQQRCGRGVATFVVDVIGQEPGVRYRQEIGRLDGLRGQLVEVVELSRIAVEHVTAVLCDCGPTAVGRLPDVSKALDALRHGVEDQSLAIEATRVRPPVTAMRTIVVAAQINADAECVGELARRLAEIAGSRPSRPAAPVEAQATVCGMGRVCVEMMAMAGLAAGSAPAETEAGMAAAETERRPGRAGSPGRQGWMHCRAQR